MLLHSQLRRLRETIEKGNELRRRVLRAATLLLRDMLAGLLDPLAVRPEPGRRGDVAACAHARPRRGPLIEQLGGRGNGRRDQRSWLRRFLGGDGLPGEIGLQEGTIQHVSVNNLNVGRNPEEVLRILDGLQTDELCPCNRTVGGETL